MIKRLVVIGFMTIVNDCSHESGFTILIGQDTETCFFDDWGRVTDGGYLAKCLLSVRIPNIERKLCQKSYEEFGTLPDGEICAGHLQSGKGSCQSDSGGLLVVKEKLSDLVSWGQGCAKRIYPGVYANVAYYRDWIRKHSGM